VASKQSKRAPGGSPALSFFVGGTKVLVAVAAVLVLLVGSLLAWWWYRPDHFVDPISRHVHSRFLECRDTAGCSLYQAGWVSLIPDILTAGEAAPDVRQKLRDAGFAQWVIEPGEEIYTQSGAAFSPFPCTKNYYVRITFESDRLQTAETSFGGTPNCL